MVEREEDETKGPRKVKVEDRRHWARAVSEDETEAAEATGTPPPDPEREALRARAEAAEAKLRDYAEAFRTWKEEQEQFRARLERDLDAKVALRFGDLVAELVDTVDDLDLALSHAADRDDPLADGIAIARDRFLAILSRHGVERLELDGDEFDPNVAEAVAVEPVDDPSASGKVLRTVRSGYRLGERVIREARVVVGRVAS